VLPAFAVPARAATSQYEGQQSFWSALQDGIITAEQARTLAVAMNQRGIAHRSRWIAHLENRLAYEKACSARAADSRPTNSTPAGGQVLRRGMACDHEGEPQRWRRAERDRARTFRATIAVEDIADYRAPADGLPRR